MFSIKATQLLNFFQTARKTFYWSSLLALVLALISFPAWHQIFTVHNLPLQIQMAAPGVEEVKVYWDNPNRHPTAYERIALNTQPWQVKVEALAEKNPQSKGTEVWILDLSTPESKVDWSKANFDSTSWELRNDPNSPQGKVAIAHSGKPQFLVTSITGSKLTIKLLRHPWSGKARVTINDRVREVDLFDRNGGYEILTFPIAKVRDNKVRTYYVDAVDTPWHRLKFLAEGGQVRITEVKARSQIVSSQGNSEFVLPWRFWNRFTCALVATFISFLWITCLLISVVHVWQGQIDKRFGIKSYIFCLSVTLGGFWMLVFYPALMSSDSLDQWNQALTGRYTTWHPPILAMLMHFTQWFTSSPSLFCFIQGSLFWGSIFLLLQQVMKTSRGFIFSTTLMMLIPSLWTYSSVIWKDVWTAIFTLFSLAFLIQAVKQKEQKKFWISVILLSIAISFRYNAIFMSIVPVVAGQFFLWYKSNFYKNCCRVLLVLIILIAPTKVIEKLPNVTENAPTAFVFINQYVGTIKNAKLNMPESQISAEKNLINQKFGAGVSDRLLDNYNCASGNHIFFSQPPIIPPERLKNNTSFILKRTLEIAVRHPIAYLKHRVCNLAYLLQIPNISYPFHTDITENSLGLRADSRLPEIKTLVTSILTKTSETKILWRTDNFLIVLIFTLVFSLIVKNYKLLFPSLIGITYISSYLIPDSFPDWRYLLLSYVCGWVCILGLSEYYLKRLIRN